MDSEKLDLSPEEIDILLEIIDIKGIEWLPIAYAMIRHDKLYSELYSQKAAAMLKKLGINGFILVYKDPLMKTLASCIGRKGYGIIFIYKKFVDNPKIPEEIKDFVLAHEVGHIVYEYPFRRPLNRILVEAVIYFLKRRIREYIELYGKIGDVIRKILYWIETVVAFSISSRYIREIDPEVIKREELMANLIAIKLTSCRNALIFAKLCLSKYRGVAFRSLLDVPALTIEEEIKFIHLKCQQKTSSET